MTSNNAAPDGAPTRPPAAAGSEHAPKRAEHLVLAVLATLKSLELADLGKAFEDVSPSNPLEFCAYPDTGRKGSGGMNEMIALPRAMHCPDHERRDPNEKSSVSLCGYAGWFPEDGTPMPRDGLCPGPRPASSKRACGRPLVPEGGSGRYIQVADFRAVVTTPGEAAWMARLGYVGMDDPMYQRTAQDERGRFRDPVGGHMTCREYLLTVVLPAYAEAGGGEYRPEGPMPARVAAGLGVVQAGTVVKVAAPPAAGR